MKIAVIGSNGQLGADVCRILLENNEDVVPLTHEMVEVVDAKSVNDVMGKILPSVVINTSAMHQVEACEADPSSALRVNALGARNLAVASNEYSYLLVHFSTDYVFDGKKGGPYIETDCPNPINAYGLSKLAGELFIRQIAERYFIFRASGLYGMNPCRAKKGLNFVRLMLKLAGERDEVRVVDDEVLTPTYTEEIVYQLLPVIRSTDYGVYHMSAEGSCSWYEFAKKIFEISGISIKLAVADPSEFSGKTPRPKYSVMENAALKSAGLDRMAHWTEGLKKYLSKLSS